MSRAPQPGSRRRKNIDRPMLADRFRSMSETHLTNSVEIPASPSQVWSVLMEVERWPEWTPSVSRLVLRTPGPLEVGSRARIHQPKLLPASWRVTELKPGREFTWVSSVPGIRVTARHLVESIAVGSRVTLSVNFEGLFGRWLARRTGPLTERYLKMEAQGLKARCTRASK